MKTYKKCALGGTFSRFHRGHQELILTGIKLSEHVVIGITTEEYLDKRPKKHPVESYEVRALRVLLFCIEHSTKGQTVEIIPLDDPYGPTTADRDIECIVVSEETFLTATEINKIRVEKGLPPLDIVAIEMIATPSNKEHLTSTKLWLLD